jgi:hypothetical protein
MKKSILIGFIWILLPLIGFSQYETMVEKLEDYEVEVDGKLILRFFNAENGKPVSNAFIEVDNIGSFNTDVQGRIFFTIPPDATYSLKFICSGFIPANYNFEVIAGTIFQNHFSVCHLLEFGSMRVVLEWDRKPEDLDAHFLKEGDYHISYQDLQISSDGIARLERDDRNGFGPESIIVKNIDTNSLYSFYVKNFSNKDSPNNKTLSKSNAIVRIYQNNQLLKSFNVPQNVKGTTWHVFNILNGKIIIVNSIGNQY